MRLPLMMSARPSIPYCGQRPARPRQQCQPRGAGNPASDLVQVWFVGMHSNVGGGYPDDALAFVPLVWMMKEAAQHGLTFKSTPDDDPDAMKAARSGEDKDGRLYDSRSGLGPITATGRAASPRCATIKITMSASRFPKSTPACSAASTAGATLTLPGSLEVTQK
jgi:hypothetical protein